MKNAKKDRAMERFFSKKKNKKGGEFKNLKGYDKSCRNKKKNSTVVVKMTGK
jgi:hypothetical protein